MSEGDGQRTRAWLRTFSEVPMVKVSSVGSGRAQVRPGGPVNGGRFVLHPSFPPRESCTVYAARVGLSAAGLLASCLPGW